MMAVRRLEGWVRPRAGCAYMGSDPGKGGGAVVLLGGTSIVVVHWATARHAFTKGGPSVACYRCSVMVQDYGERHTARYIVRDEYHRTLTGCLRRLPARVLLGAAIEKLYPGDIPSVDSLMVLAHSRGEVYAWASAELDGMTPGDALAPVDVMTNTWRPRVYGISPATKRAQAKKATMDVVMGRTTKGRLVRVDLGDDFRLAPMMVPNDHVADALGCALHGMGCALGEEVMP